MRSFALLARRARALLRMTQEEMADYMGVQQSTVSRWERGAQSPGPESLARLHQAVGAEYVAYSGRFIEISPTPKVLVSLTDVSHRLAVSDGFRALMGQRALPLQERCSSHMAASVNQLVVQTRRLERDVHFITAVGVTRLGKTALPMPVGVSIAPNLLDGTAVIDAALPPETVPHTTITLHMADGSQEQILLDNDT